MIPYLIIYLFAVIAYFKESKKFSNLFIVLMIFMVGVRDMIGGFDVYIYAELFERYIGEILFTQDILEKGFLIYFSILQQISTERAFMFIITAMLMIGLHYYCIIRVSPNISVSVFIYFCKFFLYTFVYLRQGLAFGLVWLAITLLLYKRKLLWVLLLGIFAMSFHKTAIVFLPFLFLRDKKISNGLKLIIGLGVFSLVFTGLFDVIIKLLSISIDDEKLNKYSAISGGVNYLYLIEGTLLVLLTIFYKEKLESNREKTIISNGLFLFGVIEIASATNDSFARFTWYYFFFLIVGIPLLLNTIVQDKVKYLIKIFILLYFSLVFFRLLILLDAGDFIPYKAFFINSPRNGKWDWMEYR